MLGDGKFFINIYSKGETKLGRMLSNFSSYNIETVDGKFASVEGYWYWLLTGKKDNELRTLIGFQAKQRGRDLLQGRSDYGDSPEFKLAIAAALLNKLHAHEDIFKEFVSNTLPFRHYYLYGDKVVEPKDGQWVVEIWDFLQALLTK